MGNKVEAVALMRPSDIDGANAIPFRVMPSLGQRPENRTHSPSKECSHVLHDRDDWSYQANGTNSLPEERRTGAGKSGAWPGRTNILAGKAEGEGVDGAQAGDLFCPQGTNVSKILDIRPVLSQNSVALGVDLTKRNRAKTARALKSETEAANPREEIKDAHHG